MCSGREILHTHTYPPSLLSLWKWPCPLGEVGVGGGGFELNAAGQAPQSHTHNYTDPGTHTPILSAAGCPLPSLPCKSESDFPKLKLLGALPGNQRVRMCCWLFVFSLRVKDPGSSCRRKEQLGRKDFSLKRSGPKNNYLPRIQLVFLTAKSPVNSRAAQIKLYSLHTGCYNGTEKCVLLLCFAFTTVASPPRSL